MFKKVITTDCLDSINIAIIKTLQELNIPNIQHSNYCDETFLKIKKAQIDSEPFDLLIADLTFKKDHRNEKLQSGMELIRAVKKMQPTLKILVFSIENKTYRINKLIENEGINGYVLNGRNGISELKKAIQSVYFNDAVFLSPTITNQIKDKALLEIENYDIELLKCLSKGLTQDKIAYQFKKNEIIPYGSSSIEKRINKLKILFRAKNNTHLIALTKDLGMI